MKDKKILILGAARSGLAAAKVLGKDNEIILTDKNNLNKEEKNLMNDLNVKVIITDNQEDLLDSSFDYVVKNPGILPSHPVIKKAGDLYIKVINEMEVAYKYLPKDTFIIGVTGSNGKTTTVTIINKILKNMGKDVVLGGNIGIPLSSVIEKVKKNTILLLEISDHQLLNIDEFKTNISLVVNICPTHLDYHGTFEKYKNTKKRIFMNQVGTDLAIINKSNQDSVDISSDILAKKLYFNSEENYVGENAIYINKEEIIKLNETSLIGLHNYENILAALMVIKYFKIDKNIVKETLKDFSGVEHRIEFVKTINDVSYYNDSKATNTTSASTALKTFDKPIHLILGGLEQNQNFNLLSDYISFVKCIYAIGETENRVVEFANNNNIKVIKCGILSKAVNEAYKNASSFEVVLLSPACASQDQYIKFEDRGDEFKTLVNSIQKD